ncbi:Hydroxyethylthiazole kinase family-domain-containing protein [Russula dissimulans]|nr:Hydroxyethylthiazole kinase family-domain-containing protein [Russula dissimulans]
MANAKREVDFSLYLSLRGGVTVVQVREKEVDTAKFLKIANDTITLCSKYKVPVIINDRIDVALASGAAGVHLGPSDMPLTAARRLLPPSAIIGVSCTTPEHARKTVKDGADYVGPGAVYTTSTKDVSAPGNIYGIAGVRAMLGVLEGTPPNSCGIKSTNLLSTLHGCAFPSGHALDGIAVAQYTPKGIATAAGALVAAVQRLRPLPPIWLTPKPLDHEHRNVVKTQSANVTLALGGASPIMAEAEAEQADLARMPGGVCSSTLGPVDALDGMLAAGIHANQNGKPVVFDPVGVGATAFRRATAASEEPCCLCCGVFAKLLDAWQPTVIKGNAAEIGALADSNEVCPCGTKSMTRPRPQGVDSLGGFKDPSAIVRSLARTHRCIVLLSGPTDYLSDGCTVIRLSNGHELLGQITGAGCVLGTPIATFCGAASMEASGSQEGSLVNGDMLLATATGTLALTIAAQHVAARKEVRAPGTFLPR